jgi:uncharacterized protein YjiS (DUF1127 family)
LDPKLQMQTFTMTTAGRSALQTRRASADFPMKLSPGVSLRFLLARLRAWRLRREERAALKALLASHDHLLNDIGLSRHELQSLLD